jgi:D-galactonate transporter
MDLEARTMARVGKRLVPLLIVAYFIAYLDRVNLGFASIDMNNDLHLSATAYAIGAGIFFFTYFIFEVPSNLFLERFGARKWIARIMFTWGIVSGCMAFVGSAGSFYVVRLLLGAAEAGFFPGIIFYLTLWFPAAYRGRMVSAFMVAIPLSTVVGAPISGFFLTLDGMGGLRGWQWLYILEAVPAVILSVFVLFWLTDRPADAAWLAPDERAWLIGRLEDERRHKELTHQYSITEALLKPRVLALAYVYFGCVAALYGLSFFLPLIVKGFGLTNPIEITCISAIPYLVGAIIMVPWGRHSDRTGERVMHNAVPLFLVAAGLAASTAVSGAWLQMLFISVAGIGIFAMLPVFWTLPTAFLSGASAAAGIAIINALGNLSGFVGPYAVGWLKDRTGGFGAGLLTIAALALLAMVVVLVLGHDAAAERGPAHAPAGK